jgi:ABC-type nitrate/sulfonate/bicarbonate transport system substrate-binding protein
MKTHAVNAVFIAAFLLIGWANVMASPCCIIVVPPPPPPPKTSEPPPYNYGSVYATIPVEFAVKQKLFSSNVRVEVQSRPLPQAVQAVLSMQGTLGVAPIDFLARHKAETRADVEITAVLVNRPYYSMISFAAGIKSISQLKGQTVAVSGGLDQLFATQALSASGVNPRDVNFIQLQPVQKYIALGKTGDVATVPLGWEPKKMPTFNKIEYPPKTIVPAWILFASKQTLQKEADEIRSIREGLSKAISILKSEPTAALPLLAENFGIKDKESQDRIIKNLRTVITSSVEPSPTEIQNTVKSMRALNLIKDDVILLDPRR